MEIEPSYEPSYSENFGKVIKKMKWHPYIKIKRKIYNLARASNISLYDAFREVLWRNAFEFLQYLEGEYDKIAKTVPERPNKRSYFNEDDYKNLYTDLTKKLECLFDIIVKKEWSKELEQKLLKDQLEFYQNRIEEKEKYIKELYQKKNQTNLTKSAIEAAKDRIQSYKNKCEQIRKGEKIKNKLFASAFIDHKQNELFEALYF